MNDTVEAPGGAANRAEAHLAKLNGQVAAMRAVLVQLLQEVVVAETRLEHDAANLLLQANEQLVVSALGAQMEADTAHGALDEASRVIGLDPLTGLPNRTVLLDRFEAALSHARRNGHRVALLFLDLDAFKQINDTFGHAAGDRALQLVAGCLSSLVRETDTVSRHGGDEFLVLLAEVASAADAQTVADKVDGALTACGPIEGRVGGQALHLGASIGISVYPEDGQDARTLIACADAAMYVAKRQRAAGTHPGHGLSPTAATVPGGLRDMTPPRKAQRPPESDEQAQRERDLRDVNESLVLAALGAHELLAAAEEVRRRQADLLAMVANELSNPYAPIRLAASTLGIPGAEATLLPRVQLVIEEQAERLAQMVREVLRQHEVDASAALPRSR